jgi:ubiquinone/menaquinone biosynthesis C-methylase UbiE
MEEMRIGLDANHRSHINPDIRGYSHILDVGCGAGQTLVSSCPKLPAVGIDVDFAALKLGRSLAQQASFVCGAAEHLPFRDASFDCVISRVALPYTLLTCSLSEIRRVLTPGGGLWAVLHPISVPWSEARRGNFNSYLYFSYVLLNSLLFHFAQRQIRLAQRGCESFQTCYGMRKALSAAGFDEICFQTGMPFVVTARAM